MPEKSAPRGSAVMPEKTVTVGSPSGLHARPAAVVRPGRGRSRAVPVTHPGGRQAGRAGAQHARACWRSAPSTGTEVTLEADGDGRRGGAGRAGRPARPRSGRPRTGGRRWLRVLRGIGVSPGQAAGPVAPDGQRRRRCRHPHRSPTPDRARSTSPARALAAVAADLSTHAAEAPQPGGARTSSRAQAMMAADPALRDVGRGRGPRRSRRRARHRRRVRRTTGGALAAPADTSPSGRPTWTTSATAPSPRCLGLPMPGVPDPGHPFVLVADDLAPADTASLDPPTVLALVTEEGGPTSHTAILARALGLPAVVALPRGARHRPTGRGSPSTAPPERSRSGSAEDAAGRDPARRGERRATGWRMARGPGGPPTGTRSPLLAQHRLRGRPGRAGDGARGSGCSAPSSSSLTAATRPPWTEQVAAYTAVLRALPGRRVVIRTLDAGADKPLPFLRLRRGAQPRAGRPGDATGWRRPEVLRHPAGRDRGGRPRDRGRRLGDGADGRHRGGGGRFRRCVPASAGCRRSA